MDNRAIKRTGLYTGTMLKSHGKISSNNSFEAIRQLCGIEKIPEQMIDTAASKGGIYVMRDGTICAGFTATDEQNARYKIVPTGLKTKSSKEPVLASFIRLPDGWTGVYFGTAKKIFELYSANYGAGPFNEEYKGILIKDNVSLDITTFGCSEKAIKENRYNGRAVNLNRVNQKVPHNKSLKLYKEIYDRLAYKEKFGDSNYYRLSFYIRSLFKAIEGQRVSTELRGNGYLYSSDFKNLLVSTGLIDTYGNFIYLIIQNNTLELQDITTDCVVMHSKSELLDYGFDREEIKQLPEKFKFVSDVSELIFSASLEDFDLDDEAHFNHIINERIHRFPKEYQNNGHRNICDKIKSSIEHAIKISKVDYRYVVPKYDLVSKSIQFIVPLYLDSIYGQRPELTLVVANRNGIWKVFTVLSVDDAYDNARLVSNPSNMWMS